MDEQKAQQLRHKLIEDGYCHVPDVAPPDLIEDIRKKSDAWADSLPEEEKERRRHQGSLISVYDHQEMISLITLPAALEVLRDLGYSGPRFYSGYIISKPPEIAPPLFWHQDGILWDQPVSYTDTPHQFFLMYYLIDTNRDNGCLRVIPGSHLNRHRLHGLPPAHTDEIQKADGSHPALQEDPDARLLHSAHPNHSSRRRTVITLWFCPTFDDLTENIQAFYSKHREKPDAWSDEAWNAPAPLRCNYEGAAQPPESDRIPDERLA